VLAVNLAELRELAAERVGGAAFNRRARSLIGTLGGWRIRKWT
jgi:hypothetical protein